MFLVGPFLQLPFLAIGAPNTSSFSSAGTAAVQFFGTTGWDQMLSDSTAPVAYFAEIEPWVLADRS